MKFKSACVSKGPDVLQRNGAVTYKADRTKAGVMGSEVWGQLVGASILGHVHTSVHGPGMGCGEPGGIGTPGQTAFLGQAWRRALCKGARDGLTGKSWKSTEEIISRKVECVLMVAAFNPFWNQEF